MENVCPFPPLEVDGATWEESEDYRVPEGNEATWAILVNWHGAVHQNWLASPHG